MDAAARVQHLGNLMFFCPVFFFFISLFRASLKSLFRDFVCLFILGFLSKAKLLLVIGAIQPLLAEDLRSLRLAFSYKVFCNLLAELFSSNDSGWLGMLLFFRTSSAVKL